MAYSVKIENPFLRWLVRVLLGILIFAILLLLFIRSPWGQDLIVSRVVNYISGKTNTEVAVERLYIDFSGNLVLEGAYLEDKQGDTLLYSQMLEAKIGLSPLVFQNKFDLSSLRWQHVQANISRGSGRQSFNYQFLIDALVPQDTSAGPKNKEPMDIHLGHLVFNDFRIRYTDNQMGVSSSIRIGELDLEARTTDFEQMAFETGEIYLSDSDFSYIQNSPTVPRDTSAAILPSLKVGRLTIANVGATYRSIPEDQSAKAQIGRLVVEVPQANLMEREIVVAHLALEDSEMGLRLPDRPDSVSGAETTFAQSTAFKWPVYDARINSLELANNTIHYQKGEPETSVRGLNFNDIRVTGLSMEANDLAYKTGSATADLNTLSFREKSGLRLKDLALEARMTPSSISVGGLDVSTANSSLSGSFNLGYGSFQKFLQNPGSANMQLEFPDFQLEMEEAFYIQPELSENQFLATASAKTFSGSLSAEGNLQTLLVNHASLSWGENTSLQVEGSLSHLNKTDSLSYDFDRIRLRTTREDVMAFVPQKDPGFSLPRTLRAEGFLSGGATRLDGELNLLSPEGEIELTGGYRTGQRLQFNGEARISGLRLDSILQNPQLGSLGGTIRFSGEGNNFQSLNAEFDTDFSQLQYRGYDFSGLVLHGNMTNGRGDINFGFEDENLNLGGHALVRLDSGSNRVDMDMEVEGADLQALGITRQDIRIGLNLEANFSGTPDNFKLNVVLPSAIAVYENEQYQMGEMRLTSSMDSVKTELQINSDFLNGTLFSNTSVTDLNRSLRRHFRSYFEPVPDSSETADSVRLSLDAKLLPTPLITDVFLRDISRLDSIVVRASFDAAARKMNANFFVPTIGYLNSSVDSLSLEASGNATELSFSAGLGNLLAGPIHIRKTSLEGTLQNRKLALNFDASGRNEPFMHLAAHLTFANDTTYLQLQNQNLMLNKQQWTIPESNRIVLADSLLQFKDFVLSSNGQELAVGNDFKGKKENHIGLRFKNFRLQTLLSLLNPDEKLASGSLNGDLVVENPFLSPGMVSQFTISDFRVMEQPLGSMEFSGTSRGRSEYGFELALREGGANLEILGEYEAAPTGAKLNLDLAINKLELQVLENLSQGNLKETSGYLAGNISVTGTTASPIYDGYISFHEVDFNIASLDSRFGITGERLDLDTEGVYMEQFDITDGNGDVLTLDGSILTDDILNPSFDLVLSTDRFRLLNSSKEDNELFYGTASVYTDLSVKGNSSLPRISGKLGIHEVTDLTIEVPETQLDVQERDGVVIFVNREDPDDILTRNEQVESAEVFKGLDVEASLEIARGAEFTAIIDSRTGDNLKVSGEGTLILNMRPNGGITLSGRYELQSGHYQTSLYNLVNRRFEINPGSTITWQGSPENAKLDVTAVYKVETSAAPIMAAAISGQGINTAGKYRQVLPFLVYLNVDGELLEPELSFDLDMPEDEQGSLGGAVYSRVQQLNQQEAELNKQVFSLLALNRFYPATGSDGSEGGSVAIARDNVNRVLSGELNAFSDRIFGSSGFEAEFDLDSFTDYRGETPQDRTQLNINARKRLFDDRLIVTAGSAIDIEGSAQPGQEETPIIGNVSLEYLLTENGQFRLRGFRKSEYENIIDGQLIITGAALIFNREFNEFSELFRPLETGVEQEKETKDDQ